VFEHGLHGQCPPQGKEKLLLKDLSQKRKLFTPTSIRTESHQNEYYDEVTKQMNFRQLPPAIVTSESIEPNDNDLKVNAVAYAFSKILISA